MLWILLHHKTVPSLNFRGQAIFFDPNFIFFPPFSHSISFFTFLTLATSLTLSALKLVFPEVSSLVSPLQQTWKCHSEIHLSLSLSFFFVLSLSNRKHTCLLVNPKLSDFSSAIYNYTSNCLLDVSTWMSYSTFKTTNPHMS